MCAFRAQNSQHSRNNSQPDYGRSPKSPMQQHPQNGNVPFKPVPPPKPKNYRPPVQGNASNGNMMNPNGQWENGVCIRIINFMSKVEDSIP